MIYFYDTKRRFGFVKTAGMKPAATGFIYCVALMIILFLQFSQVFGQANVGNIKEAKIGVLRKYNADSTHILLIDSLHDAHKVTYHNGTFQSVGAMLDHLDSTIVRDSLRASFIADTVRYEAGDISTVGVNLPLTGGGVSGTVIIGADTTTNGTGLTTLYQNSLKLAKEDTASLSIRINTKLTTTDTASLSNRINSKLTSIDTASLSNRINTKLSSTDTASLSIRIDTKLNTTDTASLSNRINTKLSSTDTASLSIRINTKLNTTDTASLSNRINAKLSSTDTASLSARIDTKLNTTDTASLSNRINAKLSSTDTASLSLRINGRLSPTDTVSLSNRIDSKLGALDTASLSLRINGKASLSTSLTIAASAPLSSSAGSQDLSANRIWTLGVDTTTNGTGLATKYQLGLKLDSIQNLGGIGTGVYKPGSRNSLKRLKAGTYTSISDNTDSILVASTLTASSPLSISGGGDISLGTVNYDKGGTGQTSWTAGDMLYSSATNTLTKLGIGTQGYFLSVNSSGLPAWGTMLYGAGTSDSLPSFIITNQAKNKSVSTFTQRTDTSVFKMSFTPNTGKPLLTMQGVGATVCDIDSNGMVGVGTTAHYNTQGANELALTLYNVNGSVLELARNTSNSDYGNGEISWVNTHNTGGNQGIGYIQCAVNGTSINKGGYLQFATKASGTSGIAQERMRIEDAGDIGIGETNPISKLQITQTDNGTALTVKINATQANVTASDIFVDFRSASGSEGSIAGTSTPGLIAYNTFTGAHYAQLQNEAEEIEVGMLVAATGQLMIGAKQLPLITKTKSRYDKRVYGVFAGRIALGAAVGEVDSFDQNLQNEVMKKNRFDSGVGKTDSLISQTNSPSRLDGTSVTLQPTPSLTNSPRRVFDEERGRIDWSERAKGKSYNYGKGDGHKDMYQVFAVGTGIVMVTETGGNISVGDLICPSPIAGLGERQNRDQNSQDDRIDRIYPAADDVVHSYTIAKATQVVDWKNILPDINGIKKTIISCVYK